MIWNRRIRAIHAQCVQMIWNRCTRAIHAQWVQMIWNWGIQFIDINHFPMSSGVSERANEQMNEGSRSSEQSKWMNLQCQQTRERKSEWPSTQRVNFVSFQPTVTWALMPSTCLLLFQSIGVSPLSESIFVTKVLFFPILVPPSAFVWDFCSKIGAVQEGKIRAGEI